MTISLTDDALFAHLDAFAARAADGVDPGHDILHVRRVARNARQICDAEGGNVRVAVAAALLHELFNYPKDHPDSAQSGAVCARLAAIVLGEMGIDETDTDAIASCIRTHSFSRGLQPEALEGRILQDADRLDALGAIGVARTFSTGSQMARPFYSPDDPLCHNRPPDDKAWTLDHFPRKLLRLADTLHTPTARALAAPRVAFLHDFLAQLAEEIGADDTTPPPHNAPKD